MKKKQLEQKICKWVKDAQLYMSTQQYSIDYGFAKKDKPSRHEDEGISNTIAEITTDRRYLKATIAIYPYALTLTEDRLKAAIYHEVAHTLTDPLFYIATSVYKDEGETLDARESLTEICSRMALALDNKYGK